jgi:kynurenine formamidase
MMWGSGATRKIIDLSVPITSDSKESAVSLPQLTWMSSAQTAVQLANDLGMDIDSLPSPFHLTRELIQLSVHTGTHLDAPYHYGPREDGTHQMTIDEIPLDWCWSDGVVLDFTEKLAGDTISARDIAESLRLIGHELQPGEIVLIRTGADRHYRRDTYESCHAGLTADGCNFVLDHGVRVIGTDACLLDPPIRNMAERLRAGERDQFFATHYLGRRRPYVQIEKLANLDQLPPTGFTVVALPVLISGAGGAWTRAVAIIESQS